jgi:hypothetical protein
MEWLFDGIDVAAKRPRAADQRHLWQAGGDPAPVMEQRIDQAREDLRRAVLDDLQSRNVGLVIIAEASKAVKCLDHAAQFFDFVAYGRNNVAALIDCGETTEEDMKRWEKVFNEGGSDHAFFACYARRGASGIEYVDLQGQVQPIER